MINNNENIRRGEEKYIKFLVSKRLAKVCDEISNKMAYNFTRLSKKINETKTNFSQESLLKYKISQVFLLKMNLLKKVEELSEKLKQTEINLQNAILENQKLAEYKEKYIKQHNVISKNNEIITKLSTKTQSLKVKVENTQANLIKSYTEFENYKKEQENKLTELQKFSETLLNILKKKDEEIFRLQSEKNYLSLKSQGLI